MIVNDSTRREVAEYLRNLRHLTYYAEEIVENIKDALGIADGCETFREPEDVYRMFADLIDAPERTCRDFGGEEDTNGEGYDFACSECGFCCDLPEPNYCPNCGAKVV